MGKLTKVVSDDEGADPTSAEFIFFKQKSKAQTQHAFSTIGKSRKVWR